MRVLAVVVFALVLTGCGTDYFVRYGIDQNSYTFQTSGTPDYDYLVTLKKTPDLDLDTASNRTKVIQQITGCQRPIIINEQLIDQGKAFSGFQRGTYFIKVSCPK